ncbi:hypothetical protein C7S18_04570 [Ahniella affigens]|uniref:Uncharacterized protein n=1 Tax=Ahniella affigens TaxID=2021234 RepID=A0A2P1PNW0_9GAMM|nr:hypothetical protein [Ahniella affigens]AVP96515.1 hypothetical protein C7S18_04570 [Ahniella affigens]
MSTTTLAADVPFAAYIGRVADAERKLSEYNSEVVSQAFIERQSLPVSTASPPTYTLKPGQSLALLYNFAKHDSYGNPQPAHSEFLNCGKKIRRVDGQLVTFNDMEGFTYSNDHITSNEEDVTRRGLLGKFEPMLAPEEAKKVTGIWQFNAQDIAAFAADAAFSDDANKVAGKVLEFMCFHDERDPVPFVVLRLDATDVARGETWDEKNARLKAERDSQQAERNESALSQRHADKQVAPAAERPERTPNGRVPQEPSAAAANRDAANARAKAASEARNEAARERKAALEAARAARHKDD